jgi:hypothetical protein
MGDRGPQPKYSPEDLERRLTELRRAGKTYKEIGRALGYSPNYVALLINRYEICKRGSVAFCGLPVYKDCGTVRPAQTFPAGSGSETGQLPDMGISK